MASSAHTKSNLRPLGKNGVRDNKIPVVEGRFITTNKFNSYRCRYWCGVPGSYASTIP